MQRTRAVVLLAVQALFVLSIGAKYLYERKVCPRVWVRSAQYEPGTPLRGRYLALQLTVDACSLPFDKAHHTDPIVGTNPPDPGFWRWHVKPVVQNGRLVPILAGYDDKPESTDELTVGGNGPCDRASLAKNLDYFIPDTAKGPFPLKKGEELWVEVTVPPSGPPRPIQIAISKDSAFTPLAF